MFLKARKPSTNPRFRSLLQKAVRRGHADVAARVLALLEKLGDRTWIRSRCAVITSEECWPHLCELDPNLTESGRVRWLVQIAESTKFKDAAGLGTLAYVASEGDPSVFDGTENDRAIKMLAEGIKRPGDFWNWLIENGRAKGSSWQLQKMRSFVPWATWPWDKAFILTSAFLTSTCAEHEPVRAEADSSDFPYWVAIDKHTDEGKIALREVAKKIGCPYRRLNWVSYYCESALVNSLHDSPWWEREKRWRLGRVGLTPIEAEQLWQSANVHFCDAVRVHADKLKTEINTIL